MMQKKNPSQRFSTSHDTRSTPQAHNSLSPVVCLSAMGRSYAHPSRKWTSLSAPESFYVSRRFSIRNVRCLTVQLRTLVRLTFCQTMRPRGSYPPPFTPPISKLRKDVTTSVPSASFRKLEDYKRVGLLTRWSPKPQCWRPRASKS